MMTIYRLFSRRAAIVLAALLVLNAFSPVFAADVRIPATDKGPGKDLQAAKKSPCLVPLLRDPKGNELDPSKVRGLDIEYYLLDEVDVPDCAGTLKFIELENKAYGKTVAASNRPAPSGAPAPAAKCPPPAPCPKCEPKVVEKVIEKPVEKLVVHVPSVSTIFIKATPGQETRLMTLRAGNKGLKTSDLQTQNLDKNADVQNNEATGELTGKFSEKKRYNFRVFTKLDPQTVYNFVVDVEDRQAAANGFPWTIVIIAVGVGFIAGLLLFTVLNSRKKPVYTPSFTGIGPAADTVRVPRPPKTPVAPVTPPTPPPSGDTFERERF